jgi:hypothetical protein
MMKLNSIIYLLSLPLSPLPLRTALSLAGFMRTVANLSAKGFPIGTIRTAAFSGLSAQSLDPLRTAWRELVASASTVTTWHGCTDAPLSVKNALWITFAAPAFCQLLQK